MRWRLWEQCALVAALPPLGARAASLADEVLRKAAEFSAQMDADGIPSAGRRLNINPDLARAVAKAGRQITGFDSIQINGDLEVEIPEGYLTLWRPQMCARYIRKLDDGSYLDSTYNWWERVDCRAR